jgi:hypothetical protein
LELRLLLSGSRAGCVLEPLANYTIHPASLSANRFESLMARVALLERAKVNQPLSDEQTAVLVAAQRGYRRRALAARAEQTLMTGAPGRRRAALAVLAAGGVARRRRALLTAAVLLPDWAGSRLRRQAAARGRAASDRLVS